MEKYEIRILKDIVYILDDNLDNETEDKIKEEIVEQILALEKAIRILEKKQGK